MALFLLLVLVAVVLGIIGVAADGLSYLGIVLFVADVAYAAVRTSQRARRRPIR
jgi:hypothetical protein